MKNSFGGARTETRATAAARVLSTDPAKAVMAAAAAVAEEGEGVAGVGVYQIKERPAMIC